MVEERFCPFGNDVGVGRCYCLSAWNCVFAIWDWLGMATGIGIWIGIGIGIGTGARSDSDCKIYARQIARFSWCCSYLGTVTSQATRDNSNINISINNGNARKSHSTYGVNFAVVSCLLFSQFLFSKRFLHRFWHLAQPKYDLKFPNSNLNAPLHRRIVSNVSIRLWCEMARKSRHLNHLFSTARQSNQSQTKPLAAYICLYDNVGH